MAPASECNATCSGNSKEVCGGADRNSVWKTRRTFPRHDLSVVQVRQHCGCIRQEPAFDDLLCFRNVRFRFSYVVRVVCTESQHDYSIDHCVVRRCIAFGYGGFVPDPVARLPRQSCPVVALTWGQQFRTRVPFCYYDSLGCAHVSLKWQS